MNIKDDFPILKRTVHGKPLVYLDNAATTQKPQVVIDAIAHYYEHTNANVHRGIHFLAEEATRLYEEARDTVARFIDAKSREEVIFTRNTTESINLAAFSWARDNLYPGDEVIVSIMEHHSNFVPWQQLAQERGVVLKIVDINEEGRLQLQNRAQSVEAGFTSAPRVGALDSNAPTVRPAEGGGKPRPYAGLMIGALESLLTDRTRLIAITHASNVLGTINDIGAIVQMARPRGILVLADGAQAVPHITVDVQALGVDFYAFSAHKMLGPTGIGVLYGRKEILQKMNPFLTGGDMIKRVTIEKTDWNDLPWKFEAGTPNVADAIAFGVAIEYLKKVGFGVVTRHEQELGQYCMERLLGMKGVALHGSHSMKDRLGVFSFNVEGVHPHDLATMLDEEGIAIRAGHHCANPLMIRLGIPAAARASLYLYNTREDINKLMEGIERAKKIFR